MAKHWMQDVASHMKKGAFKADLKRMGMGGGKVTMAKAEAAKKRGDPAVKRRATLAETFLRAKH